MAERIPIEQRQQATVETPTIEEPTPKERFNAFEYEGIPIDFYAFFDVPMDRATQKDKKELGDIYSWGKENDKTLGDVMQHLRDLEMQLGQPKIGVKRHTKLWNYIKIQKNIEDLMKRKDALQNRRMY